MGLQDREYSEKRNFIRMKIDTLATVSIPGQPLSYEGICHDLSGGGMLITLSEELAMDTQLEVSVSTSYGHQPMINARCSVARVQAGARETYLYGLEIVEVLDTETDNEPELAS